MVSPVSYLLNRLELNPLKEWLESHLRNLNDKLKRT